MSTLRAVPIEISTVGKLRAAVADLPDDAPIIVQVVAEDGTTWNMFLTVALGKDHGFRWAVNPAILTVRHPDLRTFPAQDGSVVSRAEFDALKDRLAQYLDAVGENL